jgi:putative phosphoribosyl transferase
MYLFRDRKDAGKQLAPLLKHYTKHPDAIVIGLPRGGMVIAHEIASNLSLPLDLICPRKLGAPNNPELAIGAISAQGDVYFNADIIEQLNVSEEYLQRVMQKEQRVAQEREHLFRNKKPPLQVANKIVILVDDGLATGATMKAAIHWAQAQKAKKIIVAVPVSPPNTLFEIQALASEVYCIESPPNFSAVGQFYERFPQTSDEEVLQIMDTTSNGS